MCWSTATSDWASRRLRDMHGKDDVPPEEMSYLDGRWVWVSQSPPPEGEDEFD